MTMSFEVDIVLALYNGEAFLTEFLQSLENQTYKNFRLVIRDDQSSDSTVQTLMSYLSLSKLNYFIINDDKGNLGVKKNFGELLQHVEAPYIMFADQDDIWFTEKIEKSLNKIKSLGSGYNFKALVFSDMSVVNTEKMLINKSFWRYEHLFPGYSVNLKDVMLQNVAAGCTMIITKRLIDIAHPYPDDIFMHDWWFVIVASVFGKTAYLNEPLVYYRQHKNNSLGSDGIGLFKSIRLLFEFKSKIIPSLYKTQAQALAFYTKYQLDLSEEQSNLLKDYATIKQSCYLKRVYWLAKNEIIKTPLIRLIGLYLFI